MNWPGRWDRNHRRILAGKLWIAQGHDCGICGRPMEQADRDSPADLGWTIDHVWPYSRYSYANDGNVVLAHRVCNNEKGSRDPSEFEIEMLRRVNETLGSWLRSRTGGQTAMAIAFRKAGMA
jgi:5-methylcytosine-specific restriction endonuclease McrA